MIVKLDAIDRFDRKILLTIAQYRHPVITKILTLVSYSGTSVVWVTIVSLLVILQMMGQVPLPEGEAFLRCMIPAGLAWIVGTILKKYISRPRPYQSILELRSLVPAPGMNDSLPSNHVSTTTAFLTTLILVHHPLTGIVFGWWFLISISRLYLGVHYLTDVLAGSFLGLILSLAFQFLF